MGLDAPIVGIVGGFGRMGSWFAELLKGHGLQVICTGKQGPLPAERLAGKCDVLVISVPFEEILPVVSAAGPCMREDSLLMDLTSLKERPLEDMLEYSSCEVVGCHPLFGPGEKNKGDLTMALCPGRGKKGISWIKGILERSGITPLIMEPAVHDRMMGIIQAANHLNTIILALCAAGSGFSLNDMEAAATPAFRERLQRIKAMLGQPSGIFSNILMDNPGRGKVLSEILRTTQRLAVMLGDGDRPGFERLFSDLGSYFIQTEEGVRSHES